MGEFELRRLISATLLSSFISAMLIACNVDAARSARQATPAPKVLAGTATALGSTLTYANSQRRFAFNYPAYWVKTMEDEESLTIMPKQDVGWQPITPADAAKNPAVSVTYGVLVRERLRQRNFPEEVDPRALKAWIQASAGTDVLSEVSIYSINGVEALETVERAVPGCERVVYWRPLSLNQLVRISTGCDSAYLAEFRRIVQSLRQID